MKWPGWGWGAMPSNAIGTDTIVGKIVMDTVSGRRITSKCAVLEKWDFPAVEYRLEGTSLTCIQ